MDCPCSHCACPCGVRAAARATPRFCVRAQFTGTAQIVHGEVFIDRKSKFQVSARACLRSGGACTNGWRTHRRTWRQWRALKRCTPPPPPPPHWLRRWAHHRAVTGGCRCSHATARQQNRARHAQCHGSPAQLARHHRRFRSPHVPGVQNSARDGWRASGAYPCDRVRHLCSSA